MPKKGRSIHVVPAPKAPGKFVVKEAGKAEPLTRPASQEKSIERGIPMAQANQSELVIHRRNGQIRDSDSYGPDPNPPKDRKH